MGNRRAYVALFSPDDPPPPPPPPPPPGFTDYYLGRTFRGSSYTITAQFNKSTTLVVYQTSSSGTVTGASVSYSASAGYARLYLRIADGESLTSITDLTLSNTYLDAFDLEDFAHLQLLDVSMNTRIVWLNLTGMPSLEFVDASLCSLTDLTLSGNTSLFELDISSNDFSGELAISNTSLEILNVDTNAAVSSLDVSGCTSLISVSADSCAITTASLPSSVTIVSLANNSFSEAEVEAVLAGLDSAGQSNGTIDISGNTPIPEDTASIANLEGKGWTVLVDTYVVVQSYSIVLSVYKVQRGTAFTMTVQGLDVNGDPDLAYVPSGPLTVSLSGDVSDVSSLTSIPATGWSSGAITITGITITGGAGDDNSVYTVSGDLGEGTQDLVVSDGAAAVNLQTVVRLSSAWTDMRCAFGTYPSGFCTHDDCDDYTTVVCDASWTYSGSYIFPVAPTTSYNGVEFTWLCGPGIYAHVDWVNNGRFTMGLTYKSMTTVFFTTPTLFYRQTAIPPSAYVPGKWYSIPLFSNSVPNCNTTPPNVSVRAEVIPV